MKNILLILSIAAVAAGCQSAATRAWQSADLPTHDTQRAFEAAKDVLARHFEIANANWTKGTIETKPQLFDRSKSGTISDFRGAGGRWRRSVSFELDRDALTMVARVAVRLEREGTAAAIALAGSGGEGGRVADVPPTLPLIATPGAKSSEQVWTEVGYDASLAREILNQIIERAGRLEKGEAAPMGLSPKAALEETRKLD
jgi:hypothetical protein